MSNNYIGDIAEDADVFFVFDTANASGASITATVVVADIEVYRQTAAPINLTQRSSTSGFTLDADHDGTTGTHMVCIDTSDNTDAGFFTTGYDYFVKLNTVTVDGVSISKWIGHFSIENRYTGVDVVAISGDTAAADNLESMLDGTGGVTLSLGQLAIVASGSDNAIIATGSGTGAGIISTGGSSGGCGAVFLGDDGAIPSGIAYGMAIHSGEVNGGGLSVLAEGIVEPAIRAIANRSDAAQFTSAGSGGAGIRMQGDAGGDGLEVVAGTTGAGISVAGGSSSGDAISASAAGSGEALNAATLALINAEADTAISDASLATAANLATVDTVVDNILLDTGELQTDLTNGGRLDLLVDSIISKVDVVDGIVDNILLDTAVIGAAGAGLTAVPWNSAWDAEVQSECTDALSAYDPPTKAEMDSAHSTTDALITTVDGIVDDILDDTAEIGTAGAGLTEAGGTGDHLGDLGGMSTAMKAEVNAEALDVINTDTLTLPGQAAPSNTPTLREAIGWLYKTMRNKKTQTATQWNLYDDAGTTIDAKATVADDGTTASKTEVGSGP